MDAPRGFLSYAVDIIVFFPVFLCLLILGIIKAAVIAPLVFVIVLVGNTALVIGLYPCHVVWTCYCFLKTNKFSILLKVLIMVVMPIPILLWPIASAIGTVLQGLGFGIALPLMATFEAVREGIPNKFVRCITDGTWSSIRAAFIMVRDFKDICFRSFFSYMDGMLEAKDDTHMDIRLLQIPGFMLVGVVGLLVDVPIIILIVIYKIPVMLYKGWKQLF